MTKYKIIYNFGGSNLQIKIDNFKNQINMIIPFTYPSSEVNIKTKPNINFYYPKYEKEYFMNIISIRKKITEIISNLKLSLPSSTSLPLSTLKETSSVSSSYSIISSLLFSSLKLFTEIDNKYSQINTNFSEKKITLKKKINAFNEVFIDLSTNLYTQKINNFNIYDQIRYEKHLGFSFQIQGLLNHNEDPNCYTLVKIFEVDNYKEPVACCSVIALRDINEDEELTISHYLSYEEIYNILYQHDPGLLMNFKNVKDYTKNFFEYKNMSKQYLLLLNYLLSMESNENQIIQRINEQCNFFQLQSILLLKLLLNNRNRIKFKNKDQFPEQISIELEENKKLKDIVLANEYVNLVQQWETAHHNVSTLTVFNGHLYSGGSGNIIQKWNENGELVQQWNRNSITINEWINTLSSVNTLTVFNGYLYSGGSGNKIQKWNENGQFLHEWETAHSNVSTLTVFKRHLYSGGSNKKIQKWNENGELVKEWDIANPHVNTLTVFNGYLYSDSLDNKIQKWNENGELVQEWETAHPNVWVLTVFNGHLYSGGQDSNKIQKWNKNGELVQEWETADPHVRTLTVFNRHLYSSSFGNKIQKWNENGELVKERETAHPNVSTLTVFNGHLYSGGSGKKIGKWNDNGDGRFLLESEYEILKIYNTSIPRIESEFEKSIDIKIKTVFSDYLFNLNFFTEISINNRNKNNDKYDKIERILKNLEENSIIYKFIDNQKDFLLDSEITKIISHIADS